MIYCLFLKYKLHESVSLPHEKAQPDEVFLLNVFYDNIQQILDYTELMAGNNSLECIEVLKSHV